MRKITFLTMLSLSLVLTANTIMAQSSKISTSGAAAPDETSLPAPEQAAAIKSKKPKKEKKICKSNAPTGSRIGKKTCLTKTAWDEMGRKARDTLDSSTRPMSNNKQGD